MGYTATDPAAVWRPNDEEQQRQQLRRKYQLRELTFEEEGFGVAKTPKGVYGFTYAPGTETPMFRKHCWHSFEVHKLHDGSVRLVGFVAAADYERWMQSEAPVRFKVYPSWSEAHPVLIHLPFDNFVTGYRPQREEGSPIEVEAVSDGVTV